MQLIFRSRILKKECISKLPDIGATVLVYCSEECSKSSEGVRILKELNYKNVYEITWPIDNGEEKNFIATVSEEYYNLEMKYAKQALERENRIKVIDVRNVSEYEEKHIPNALNIPLDQLMDDIHIICPDKKTTIYVYCSKGIRSQKACKLLVDDGYKNVYNISYLRCNLNLY